MTKDVLVMVSGQQIFDSESDTVEVINRGEYFKKEDKEYILYEGISEDGLDVIKNMIKIRPTGVDITTKGEHTVHMVFEAEKKNYSFYTTPMGKILLGIKANEIIKEESEEKLKLTIDYSLEINYQHVSDNVLTVEVFSKDSREFRL